MLTLRLACVRSGRIDNLIAIGMPTLDERVDIMVRRARISSPPARAALRDAVVTCTRTRCAVQRCLLQNAALDCDRVALCTHVAQRTSGCCGGNLAALVRDAGAEALGRGSDVRGAAWRPPLQVFHRSSQTLGTVDFDAALARRGYFLVVTGDARAT